MENTLALIGPLGTTETIVIGIILLLLFGRRLPEVGRSLGQGIVEFKKGLKDVTDDIKNETAEADSGSQAPKFESAKPPKNPDMLSSAHTTSTPVAEKIEVETKEDSAEG
ncbi:MAG: Sec-independent protein translocase subunit TatA/TatB [Phycisphaerales bacterium]